MTVTAIEEPEPAYIEVSISSIPLGADVWIDGKSVGKTLLPAVSLLEGQRQITLTWGEKTIRKKLMIRRLRKDFEKFTAAFEQGINDIKKDTAPQVTERTVAVWKRYMERLEDRPYTKLTTKEILASGLDEQLKDSLKGIDSNIYGRQSIKDLHRNFEVLEDFTVERYRKRINEVKNG